MTEAKVYDLLCEIHSVFAKKEPARASGIVEALVRRVEDIPDSAARYIFDRIADMPAMPSNMGKAFRDGWEAFLRANPQAAQRGESCPLCYGNGGWEAWEPAEEGQPRHHFFAFCPKCGPKKADTVWEHPSRLQARGVLVMPSTYPGGRVQFEKDYGLGPMGSSELGEKCRSLIEARQRMGSRGIRKGYSE